MRNKFAISRCCCDEEEVLIDGNFLSWEPYYAGVDGFGFWSYGVNNSSQQAYSFPIKIPEFGAFNDETYCFCFLKEKVDLAQGATISSATLDLFPSTANTSSLTPLTIPIKIWLWDGDNGTDAVEFYFIPPDPPTTPNDNWSTHGGSWSSPISQSLTTTLSLDITSHIQSVINRPGWVSGNYIAVLIATDLTATSDPDEKTWFGYLNDSTVFIPPTTIQWVRNYVRIMI